MHFDKLRKQIINSQEGKCNRCGLSEWLCEPIPLEIDHKDGNRKNDDLENLEALCPNCHALTKTWRGRNKASTKITDDVYINSLRKNKTIRQALIHLGVAPKGANYARAKRLIEKYNIQCGELFWHKINPELYLDIKSQRELGLSYRKIALEYDVTPDTIRTICMNY